MWIVQINSVEITLPVDENVFFCSTTNDTELKSTDFDLYYTQAEYNALGLSGILEVEDDNEISLMKPIEGRLYSTNYSIDVPCTLTVNYVCLTRKYINVTVSAAAHPANIPFNKMYQGCRYLADQQFVNDLYPLGIGVNDYDPNAINVWAGWAANNREFLAGNMPIINFGDIITTAQVAGWTFNNLPAYHTNLRVAPNTIYADGNIKMRRIRYMEAVDYDEDQTPDTYDHTKAYLVKGEYAGLYTDTIDSDFEIGCDPLAPADREMKFVFYNKFRTEDKMQSFKNYFQFDTYDYGSGKFLEDVIMYIRSDRSFTLNISAYGTVASNVPSVYGGIANGYEVTISGWSVLYLNNSLKDNWFEVIPDVPVKGQYFETQISGRRAVNAEPKTTFVCIDMQQHFNDGYYGYKKIKGDVGDTTMNVAHAVYDPTWDLKNKMHTSCFDSRAWGCNIWGDYNGSMECDGFVDTGYQEDLYNVASGSFVPLMYVNRFLCLDSTLYDLLWVFAWKIDKLVQYDTNLLNVSFTESISAITNVEEYITDEHIYPSDDIEKYCWKNRNEYTESWNDHAEEYSLSESPETDDFTTLYESQYTYGEFRYAVIDYTPSGTAVTGCGRTITPIIKDDNDPNGKIGTDLTLLHDFTNLESGFSSLGYWAKTQCVMWLDGEGYYMFWENIDDPNKSGELIEQDTVYKIVTRRQKRGIKMEITLPLYISTPYVNVQNRTWYILSQELADDDTNKVELLLYTLNDHY